MENENNSESNRLPQKREYVNVDHALAYVLRSIGVPKKVIAEYYGLSESGLDYRIEEGRRAIGELPADIVDLKLKAWRIAAKAMNRLDEILEFPITVDSMSDLLKAIKQSLDLTLTQMDEKEKVKTAVRFNYHHSGFPPPPEITEITAGSRLLEIKERIVRYELIHTQPDVVIVESGSSTHPNEQPQLQAPNPDQAIVEEPNSINTKNKPE